MYLQSHDTTSRDVTSRDSPTRHVGDLFTDLRDGELLLTLLEKLAKVTLVSTT